MMYSKLAILDISSVVYPRTVLKAGADYWGGKTTTGREEIKGLPVGGIREVLNRSFTRLRDQIPVVWVFDSKENTRKSEDPAYKATRSFTADVVVQTEILKDLGNRLGIPCFHGGGFEADEYIYKVVYENLDLYHNMEVLTSDKGDMAGVILHQGIQLIGTNSQAATITRSNYEFAIRAGVPIKYNSVLPYNVFCGKPSNNLGVLKLPSGTKAKDYYLGFLGFCTKYGIDPASMSKVETLNMWIATAMKEGTLPREDALVILERSHLCYPRDIPGVDCRIPFYTYRSMDVAEVTDVLRMFNMNSLARFLGITESVSDDTASRAAKAYLWQFRTIYTEGTYQVDNGLSLRTEAFGGIEDFGVEDIE